MVTNCRVEVAGQFQKIPSFETYTRYVFILFVKFRNTLP